MSSEIETSQVEQDLKALEAFLVDNEDLERLETLLDRFNIFEATGFIRQELRHSDLLAFLLNPKANHGLGDAFLKSLLRRVLLTAAENVPVSVTPVEVERWGLNRTEVRREWQYIDILLLDEAHELAVIIENKIDTIEHSDQLRRYCEIVRQHYPDWRILAIYLTRGGDPPSHECYLPVAYDVVCEIVDSLAKDPLSGTSPDAKVMLEHYSEMLRRNIVVDSDVARLCRKIYQDHKRALDLIYEHRPDPQEDIGNLLRRLIDSDERVTYKRRFKQTYIYFHPSGWGASTHGSLDFVFHNLPGELDLFIEVSAAGEEARRRLFDVARRNRSLFGQFMEHPGTGLNPKLYRRTFLNRRFYEEGGEGEREEEIRRHWEEFLDEDLPRIDDALKEERWIWEPVEESAAD